MTPGSQVQIPRALWEIRRNKIGNTLRLCIPSARRNETSYHSPWLVGWAAPRGFGKGPECPCTHLFSAEEFCVFLVLLVSNCSCRAARFTTGLGIHLRCRFWRNCFCAYTVLALEICLQSLQCDLPLMRPYFGLSKGSYARRLWTNKSRHLVPIFSWAYGRCSWSHWSKLSFLKARKRSRKRLGTS